MKNNISNPLHILSSLVRAKSIDEISPFDAKNIDELYSLSINHGVANQINSNLTDFLSKEKKIVENTQQLSSLTQLNIKLTTFAQHSKVISTITDNAAKNFLLALAEAEIKVVVLKGFSLGYQVYKTSYLRPKTDVDILIRNEDKRRISEIFVNLGYSNPRGWEPQAINNQFSMKKMLSKGVSTLFDVHLKISNSKQIENILNYDELLISANSTQLTNINLINKPYALIHAIFHLLHHKSSGDLIKLIWHYDLYLITKQLNETELVQLKELIKSKGLSNLVQYTLTLTANYLPTNELQHLIEWCNTSEITKTYQPQYDYLLGRTLGIKGVWLTLCATEGLSNKVAIIQEMVFPPAEEIYIKYGKDSGWPLVMLYIRRIFTGSIKYIFKKKK
ncbi:nucleotidyltransferase family protein [Pseudocolwellia sp. HL-MZ7]|uniref:nucleotidyltransferase family protein n=1 Tax=Pseudocolwellia sp. HL-MZ7 TaxID=3400627 RepID=UPI003CF179C9